MSDVRDFRKIEGGKPEACLYCGQPAHSTPLACPRIKELMVSEEGYVCGITFVDDFFDDDTPPAA